MRLRATLGALALRLDGGESPEEIAAALEGAPEMPLEVEVAGATAGEAVAALLEAAAARGLEVRFRPQRGERRVLHTEVVDHTLRSGMRVDSAGTVVVLGDVNAGAEVVAGGDVIVVGALRGLAHAGAEGNEHATIWALELAAKQLRIAGHVAVSPDEAPAARGPERARVEQGQIVIERWGRRRSGA
ncbi:MAG TPA: septum site-determining protein MinC [Oceanithermus profundus]|uniref:Septum site-determining protein MinC n=1 Tax=Oceanithermus profundus TaxID=187137 RepID=A0A7C4V7A4_9DEIN|nr:septum site-determining protein MinC [Oceanithermus profundus]